MRPDEHKKKQRADYKKKHGISNKTPGSKEKDKSSKDDNNTGTQAEENSCDVDEGNTKQFSRRGVASNWDRYEDFDDSSGEEDGATSVKKRGEDFTLLVQRSANPEAQFRFQSEKDWDGDSETDSVQVAPSALEIDFGALAASLHCVPLHKRLNISVDHIYPDLLKEFQESADSLLREQSIVPLNDNDQTVASMVNQRTVSANSSQQVTQDSGRDQVNSISSQPSKDSKPVSIASKSSKNFVHIDQFSSTIGSTNPQNTEDLQTSLRDVLQNRTTNLQTKLAVQEAETSKTNEDDELEFLLSLETPKNVTNQESSGGYSSKEATSFTNVPSSPASQPVKPAKEAVIKAEDDLEDWLDSVLG